MPILLWLRRNSDSADHSHHAASSLTVAPLTAEWPTAIAPKHGERNVSNSAQNIASMPYSTPSSWSRMINGRAAKSRRHG